MVHFRTIRQRRHRARRGQVSAVATVLGLLLVVIFVSSFVLQQLPDQMAQLEFDHVNEVQNQLSRLQTSILTQVANPSSHLNLVSPVTLGSSSVPPFSQPSTGSITPEPANIAAATWFSLGVATPAPPNWNTGTNTCASGTSGTTCTTNGVVNYWNFTGTNHTTLTIKVTGANNGLVYDFSGSNDTINIQWSGAGTTFIRFVVNGSDNVVNYQKSGTDVGNPVVNFQFFGMRNKFTFNPAGSHSGAGGMQLAVSFSGSQGNSCPYGNTSGTNKVGTLGTGGSNINMSVVWTDAVGYVTPVHLQAYPGGVIPTETLRWSNTSAGFVPCAFTQVSSQGYGARFAGGLDVHLFNRYSPAADVVYEGGAVLLAQVGGSALMISPPSINVTQTTNGLFGKVTLINLVANLSAQGGIQTAGVTSLVLQAGSVPITNGVSQTYLSSPYWYNVTTYYPSAWLSYMNSNPDIFPSGGVCIPSSAIVVPFTCANPPSGVAVTVSGAMILQRLTITSATVLLTIS